MPVDPATRRAADAIRARAESLARAPVDSRADQDAEFLTGLASGTLSLAEVEDEPLERLVTAHGTDTIVRAILSNGSSAPVGNRLPTALPRAQDETRPAQVLSFPRRLVAAGSTRRLAAAASVVLAVGVGVMLATRYGTSGGGTSPDVPGPQVPGGGNVATGPNVVPRTPARTAVLINGNDRSTTSLAETTILRALSDRQDVVALDEDGVRAMRGDSVALDRALQNDFGPIAEIGRRLGVDVLVVGDLTSRAAQAVGPDYAGTAELRLTMYRVSTGRIVDSKTFVVGPGAARPDTPPADEAQARLQAAEKAIGDAVGVVTSWLLP
jgi:hypothetical protein